MNGQQYVVDYNDLMSSDDSSDDNYNYLTALDNINWKCQPITAADDDDYDTDINNTTTDRLAAATANTNGRQTTTTNNRPAIAVNSRSNRTDGLLRDMMASNKDSNNVVKNKTTTMTTTTTNDNNKKDGVVGVGNHTQQQQQDIENNDHMEEDIDIAIPTVVVADNRRVDDNRRDNRANDNRSDNRGINSMGTTDRPNGSNNNNNNKRQKITTNVKQSEYSVQEVLNRKKANHEKCVVNNNKKTDLNRVVQSERTFGKAFSPTVYAPEVPVMRGPVPPLTGLTGNKRRSLTLNENVCESKYSPDSVLAIILDWNTKWLSECVANEVPPPLSPYGDGCGVQISYDSLEEYQSAYIPLLLFETWAQIFDEFNNSKSRQQSQQQQQTYRAVINPEYSSDEHFITISFQTLAHRSKLKTQCYPTEGHLIIVDLVIDIGANNEKRKISVFGYVSDYSKEPITPTTMTFPGLAVSGKGSNNQMLLKYTVFLMAKPLRLNCKEGITFRDVYYLKPTLRQIELISSLNTCQLFKDILKPRSFTCQVVVPTNITMDTTNFNESQIRAIHGSCEIISRPYAVPKVLLIQGPPGTGKTHTLIGIIKRIYMKCDSVDRLPRILICAPSNGAVDEITRRLYREREFLRRHKCRRALRCVRVGKPSQMHEEVRKISLDALIDDNMEKEVKKLTDERNKQMKDIEKRISQLEQENANLRVENRKQELLRNDKEMADLVIKLEKLSSSRTKTVEHNKNRIKLEIMDKADIILVTLNSSHSSSIETLYHNYREGTFNCVIVDEASQCSEPELLMPLAYRMTKMILIGDPKQLPATVISKKAHSLRLGRSLFERFFDFFADIERKEPDHKSPILMLNEQYRMHPQICEFPSQQFYSSLLKTSDKLKNARDFKLKPYIVFDVTDTVENKSDPTNKYNELEAEFVLRVINIIDKILIPKSVSSSGGGGSGSAANGHRYSVGIITPYSGQKNFINRKLENKHLNINIDVNTVDGFQGQERDLIILSCVRAFDKQNNSNNSYNSIGFMNSLQRMNVALTRAKYTMIVCISGRSLECDPNWKALIDNAVKRITRYKVPSTLGEDKLKKMLKTIELIDCD
ncbi:probable helicase senataxin [Oppia nitens]|uniref:probable helicase senataxin n=1 Tax=Oppia nitens TaxID=1686743 RepID=UPI0023DC5D20|nr:probable helicase senataxin [Oppia nitens]